MKALDVDLRSRAAPTRAAWLVAGLVAATAVACVVGAVLQRQRIFNVEARLVDARAQLAGATSQPVPIPTPKPYEASARRFLALATSQWPNMLTALESVEVVGVTPNSIEILASERVMRVEVQFSDYSALLTYVGALNAGEPTPRWALVQAQTVTRAPAVAASAASIAVVQGEW